MTSWGRYPPYPQTAHDCSWRHELPQLLEQLARRHGETLPFGNGRSYGDSCLATSDQVLRLLSLDRILAVDWSTGRLRAEAGITLGEILAMAVPRGWFLPVVPGTRFATLGGAIANDVHGKNHHRNGTFGRHVTAFGLVRSDQGIVDCTPREHPDLFSATIGGLGLTGLVTWADIQLQPIQSSNMDSRTARFDDLDGFFALSDAWDPSHEYSVAWIDCLRSEGRGVYSAASHSADDGFAAIASTPLAIPITPPVSLVNSWSLKIFNEFYWQRHSSSPVQHTAPLERFFFPLDRIHHWNRIYGRRGFQQYQCVLPQSVEREVLPELLAAIQASGRGSFLAVLKRCGDLLSPGLLSFPMPGTSLALDFPQHRDLEEKLFPHLDALVHEVGGRLYPAKDAHMQGTHFQQAYPGWERLEALRDPALNSRFWKRVTT